MKDSSTLTAREKQILRLRRDGLAPKQIARVLGLSIYTIRHHMERIQHKLGVSDTHKAVLVDYVMETYLEET